MTSPTGRIILFVSMIATPIKTSIFIENSSLFDFITTHIPTLQTQSIIVITSKIVGLSQGRTKPATTVEDKHDLIRKEADWYIDDTISQYGVILTIKNNILIASAGIDESNANQKLIMWPTNLPTVTEELWIQLKKYYNTNHLGILITDSRITPMRWGTIGVGLSWCGFSPLNNYINTPDIFGRKLRMTKASILDGLAASAVLVMGEGNEQTPLAVIEDVPFVTFTTTPPTEEDIKNLCIEREDDLFSPILTAAPWKKGGI